MKKRKEFLPLLTLGTVSLTCVILTFYFVNPEKAFYGASPVIIFFVFIFLLLFGFLSYLFMNMVRGILVSFFITSILILQIIGNANLFYIIILLFIVVALDMGIKKH